MRMVDALLGEFEQHIDELRLIPGSGGVYEVEVDGALVYSKKAAGRHAEYEEVAAPIRELVG